MSIKPLVFNIAHGNSKLISAADLDFLTNHNLLQNLQNSKLTSPRDHVFQDIAEGADVIEDKKLRETKPAESVDPRASFLEAIGYISSLRQSESKGNLQKPKLPIAAVNQSSALKRRTSILMSITRSEYSSYDENGE